MSDITRDNSLVTMLLVAYERNEGQSYLSTLLTQPLKSIFPLLSNCEMDPQKLKSQFPEASQAELDAKLESNRKTLESACEILFDGIFDSSRRVPFAITEMCQFLHETIETVLHTPAITSKQLSLSPPLLSPLSPTRPFNVADELGNHGNEKDSSNKHHNPQKAKGLIRMLSKKKLEFKVQDKDDATAKNVLVKNLMIQTQAQESTVDVGEKDLSESLTEHVKLGQTYLEGDFEAPPSELINTPRMSSSTTPLYSNSDIAFKNEIKTESSEIASKSESKSETPRLTQIAPQQSDFSLKSTTVESSETSMKGSSKDLMMRRPTMGALGITTPEANGIFLEKITPNMRRGLVLCGKMVTSLCNDNEFGHKDMSLMPCNEFLIPHRQRMKAFLHRCIADTTKSENKDRESTSSNSLARKALSNPHLDMMVKSHSRVSSQPLEKKNNNKRLKSLSMENLSPKPKAEADPDVTAFFQTLFKSLDRIGKDLQEQKKSMSPQQIASIDKKFVEMKKLLEVGYLDEDATPDKKVSFWAKFVSIFK